MGIKEKRQEEKDKKNYMKILNIQDKHVKDFFDNPFLDVKQGAFYYYPVLWAANNGITSGVNATTFNPSGDCTRGQIVTFLYRYNNEFGVEK